MTSGYSRAVSVLIICFEVYECSMNITQKQLLELNFDYSCVNCTIPDVMYEAYKQNKSNIYCLPGTGHANIFKFNLTGFNMNVTDTELHVYSLGHHQDYILRIHQLISDELNPDLHPLIIVHYIKSSTCKWHVFNIKNTLKQWINGATNNGVLFETTTLNNNPINVTFINSNMIGRRPFLIIQSEVTSYLDGPEPINTRDTCELHQFEVSFHEMMNIVLPKKYYANKCVGNCDVLTNNYVKLVGRNLCCVPVILHPLLVLYYDGDWIVLRYIQQMIVTKCACL